MSNEIKKEDLKQGEYYIMKDLKFGYSWLLKHNDPKHTLGICINGDYYRNNANFDENYQNVNIPIFRVASSEEKHWLDCCIGTNKFLSKEEALRSFKKELEFIVGKWYKGMDNTYLKFSHKEKKDGYYRFHYTETIDVGKHSYSRNFCSNESWINKIEESGIIPLEEIQKFLPDGHPDKIKTSTELTSLPEKWCIISNDEIDPILVKWRGGGHSLAANVSLLLSNKYWVNINEKQIYIKGGFTEITFEQFKKWVLKEENTIEIGDTVFNCKMGKNCVVISDSDYNNRRNLSNIPYVTIGAVRQFKHTFVKKGNDYGYVPELKSEVKEEIPEYLECIKEDSGIKIGSIYKYTAKGSIKDCIYIENGKGNYYFSYFIPSTKEAYDAQNSKSEEQWIPKVGDWCVITKLYHSVTLGKAYKILDIMGTSVLVDHDGKKSFSRPYITHIRKALPHEIPITDSSGSLSKVSSEESLLEEAIRKYPIGTKLKECLANWLRYDKTGITTKIPTYMSSDNTIWVKADRFEICIYRNGKWAEIISTPNSETVLVSNLSPSSNSELKLTPWPEESKKIIIDDYQYFNREEEPIIINSKKRKPKIITIND